MYHLINLPNLRQLQYLIALHKHNHFKKAADACFVSQSTLSAAIAQLEEILGCELLERQHKSFIFTAVGEQVVKDAKALVQAGTDLLQYTKSHNQPMCGQLVLGCIPTIAPFVLGSIAKNTAVNYPDLTLLLREDTSDNLIEALSAGEVDMVILALPYKTEGFKEVVLAEDPFNFVVHKDTLDKYGTDMRKMPNESLFLMRKEHCLTEHTKSICKLPEHQKLNPFFATSLQTLVQMVEAGKGATFLPQMAINSQILNNTGLQVRRAEPTGAHRKIGLLWRQSNKRVATFHNMANIITEVVRSKCVLGQPF